MERRIALGRKISAGAGLAPRAGAGTYFHERVKVGKGLPKGEYRFSPFGFPLNDQRLCLWNPTELPLCIYFPHRNKPVRCRLQVRFCFNARKSRSTLLPIMSLRANESALKMTVDGRLQTADYLYWQRRVGIFNGAPLQ